MGLSYRPRRSILLEQFELCINDERTNVCYINFALNEPAESVNITKFLENKMPKYVKPRISYKLRL